MHYFGYGSLVNRQTRPDNEAFQPVSVMNWQRAWAHRVQQPGHTASVPAPEKGFTVLTVAYCKAGLLDGVQVTIDDTDIPQLDAREAGYERQITRSDLSTEPVAIYVSRPEHVAMANADYPLLQSYTDCVLAGYLDVFGWAGVDRFIGSTQGWSAPIFADREQPIYPRAVSLSVEVTAAFDERIAAVQQQERVFIGYTE